MLANPDIGVTQIAHGLGVSPAALYLNREYAWRFDNGRSAPATGRSREGFSLAGGGGRAPSAATPGAVLEPPECNPRTVFVPRSCA